MHSTDPAPAPGGRTRSPLRGDRGSSPARQPRRAPCYFPVLARGLVPPTLLRLSSPSRGTSGSIPSSRALRVDPAPARAHAPPPPAPFRILLPPAPRSYPLRPRGPYPARPRPVRTLDPAPVPALGTRSPSPCPRDCVERTDAGPAGRAGATLGRCRALW